MSIGRAEYNLELKGLDQVIRGINQVQKEAQKAAKSANTAFRNIGKTMQTAGTQAAASGKGFQNLSTQLNQVNAAAKSANAGMNSVGQSASGMGKQLGGAYGALQGFNKSVANVGTAIRETGFNITRVGQELSLGLTLPLAGAAAAVVGFGSQFESAFAGVVKTVADAGESAADLEPLRQGLRDLATELPQSAVEIAGVAEAAGQLGIQRENILEFTRVMVDMGVATNLSSQEAAVALARIATITGLTADQYDNLGSAIVGLGNNFATTESEIINLVLRLASAGKVVGFTTQETLAFATAMRAVGISAERGGTAMQRVLFEINTAVKGSTEELEVFAHVAGMTNEEFQRMFESTPAEAVEAFIVGLGRLNAEGVDLTGVLESVNLQNVRTTQTLLTLAESGSLLGDTLRVSRRDWAENIALTQEAERRYATVESQLQILKNRGIDLLIEAFDALRPVILDIINALNGIIDGVRPYIDAFAQADQATQRFILGIGAFVAAIGPITLAIGGVVTAVGAFISIVGSVGVVVSAIVGSLVALGAAYLAVKTNQDFFADRVPGLVTAMETLEEAVGRLTGSFDELGTGDATSAVFEIGAAFVKVAATIGASIGIIIADVKALVQSLIALNEFAKKGLLDIEFNDPKNILLGQDPFLEIKTNINEINQLGSDFSTIWGENRATVGAFEDFFAQAMSVSGADIEDFFNTITEGGEEAARKLETAQGIMTTAASDFEGSFGRFQDLMGEFVTKGATDFDELKKRITEFAVTTGGLMETEIIKGIVTANDESELWLRTWIAVSAGFIDTSYLMAQAFYDTAEGIKFAEDNTWDWNTAASELAETLDQINLERMWDGIGASAGVFTQLRDNIAGIRDGISLWESDAATAQEAIDLLTGTIEKQGFATAEQSEQLELLNWHHARLTNGIEEDMNPAFIQAAVNQAKWQKITDEINEQFRGEDGTIKNTEAYARAMEEASKEFLAANDPMAMFIGDMQSVADSFKDTIELIRQMFIELGLLPPDPFSDMIDSASRSKSNVGGLGDEIVEVGEAASKEPVIKVWTDEAQGEVAGLGDELVGFNEAASKEPVIKVDADGARKTVSATGYELWDLHNQKTEPKVSAETGDAETKIGNLSSSLIGFTDGSPYETVLSADSSAADGPVDSLLARVGTWASTTYTGTLSADAASADETVDGLLGRVGTWATSTYTGTLDADTSAADTKIDPLLARVGAWATSTYTATMTIDTSQVYPAVDAAAGYAASNLIAQSPTEEGPLSVYPDWDYLFEGIESSAQKWTDAALEHMKLFIETAKLAFETIGTGLDITERLSSSTVSSVSEDILDPIFELIVDVSHGMAELAVGWEEEVLEQTKSFLEMAQTSVDLVGSAVDALQGLQDFEVDLGRASQAASDIKFLIEHIILSLGDSFAAIEAGEGIDHPSVRGQGFVSMADAFAKHALSGVELIGAAIENLADLGSFDVDLDSALQAATKIKFLVEHIVLALGDSAAIIESGEGVDHPSVRGDGFVGMAANYAENAQKAVALVADALAFISELSDFDGTFNLAAVKEFASNLKFLIEHIVLSIGDTAMAIATESDHPAFRGEGFVGIAATFAESASTVVSLMAEALGFLSELASFDGEYNLESVLAFASDLKFIIEHIVLSIGDAAEALAQIRPEGFLTAVQAYSEAVEPAVSLVADTVGFLIELNELVGSLEEGLGNPIDFRFVEQTVANIAILIERIAVFIGEAALSIRDSQPEELLDEISKFSENLSPAVGLLADIVGFLGEFNELVESIGGEAEASSALVFDNMALEPLIASLARTAEIVAEEIEAVAGDYSELETTQIANFADVVSSAAGALSDVVGLIGDLKDGLVVPDMRGIAAALSAQARIIAEEFAAVAEDFRTDVNESAATLATEVGSAVGAISDVFDFLQNFVPEVDDDGRTTPIITTLEGLRGIARQLAEQARVIAEEFAAAASEWNTELNQSITDFEEAVSASLGALNEIFDFIERVNELTSGGGGGSGYDTHSAFGRGGINPDGSSRGGGGSNPIVRNLEAIGETIGLVVAAFIAALEEHEAEMARVRTIVEDFTAAFSAITTTFITGTISQYEAFSIRYGTIHAEMTANVLEIWQGGAEQMIGVGENFINGMIQGLENEEGALYAKVKQIVDDAIDAANDAAENASPSKRMIEVGENFGLGFAVGVENTEQNAIDVTASLVQSAITQAVIMVQAWEDFNAALNAQGDNANARFFSRLESLSEFADMFGGVVSNFTGVITDFADALEIIEDPAFFSRVTSASEKMARAVIASASIMVQAWEDFNAALNAQGDGANARFFSRLEALSEFADLLSSIASNLSSAVESLAESFESLGLTLEEGIGAAGGVSSGSGTFVDALNDLFGTSSGRGRGGGGTFIDALGDFLSGNVTGGSAGNSTPAPTATPYQPPTPAPPPPTPQAQLPMPGDAPAQIALRYTKPNGNTAALLNTPTNIKYIDPSEWLMHGLEKGGSKPKAYPTLGTGWGLQELQEVNAIIAAFEDEDPYDNKMLGFASGGLTLGDGMAMLHKDEAIINPTAQILNPLGEAIVDAMYDSMRNSGMSPLDRIATSVADAALESSYTSGSMNRTMNSNISNGSRSEAPVANVVVNAPDTRPETIQGAVSIASRELARRLARK